MEDYFITCGIRKGDNWEKVKRLFIYADDFCDAEKKFKKEYGEYEIIEIRK